MHLLVQNSFFVTILSSPPLPDPEKFDSSLKNSSPASKNFPSPLPLKILKFLSHSQSRVVNTLCDLKDVEVIFSTFQRQ